MFLDKVETQLKGSTQETLVSSLFTGTVVNQVRAVDSSCVPRLCSVLWRGVVVQVICKCCGTVKEREELFHHIPLDVKVNKNIHEAFTQYVGGETVQDFQYVAANADGDASCACAELGCAFVEPVTQVRHVRQEGGDRHARVSLKAADGAHCASQAPRVRLRCV